MRFVVSPDGVPIAYSTYGTGKTALVLIHGWSCDTSYWAAQLQPLSRDFQVVALDLGGHGESGTGRKSFSIESFGQDVAAVVEAINPEQVVLVGHSMGGTVAIAAARQLGKRVRAVVWVDSYRKLGSPRSSEEVEEVLAPFRANFKETTGAYVRGLFGPDADEALVNRVAEHMSAAHPAIAISALESSLTFGRTITETIKEVPIAAINACAPADDVESIQRHGVEVVTLPSTGHFPMMEAPRSFNKLLKQVVSDRPSADTGRAGAK